MPQLPDLSKLTSAEKDAVIHALVKRVEELAREVFQVDVASPPCGSPTVRPSRTCA